MLRQKRRSTGVVRLKGSDDEEEKSAEKANDHEEKVCASLRKESRSGFAELFFSSGE